MTNVRVISNQEITCCRGYIKGKDINKNDMVRDCDGDYHNVTNISEESYDGKAVNVRVNGYFPFITLLPDSSVFIYRGKKEERSWEVTRWVPASELCEGDMIVYKVNGSSECSNGLSKFNSSDYALLFGYYLISGFCDKRTDTRVVFKEEKSVEGIVSKVKVFCQKKYKTNFSEHDFSGEDFFTVDDKELYDVLSIFGRGNKDKRISEEIINSKSDFLSSLLFSFLLLDKDSRGSYFRPSSSLDLLRGYQRMLIRFNAFSNIYDCISKNGKFNYFAIVMNEVEREELSSSINSFESKDRWFKDDSYAYLKVIKVEEKDISGKVCTFSIEGKSVLNHVLSYK